MVKDPGAIQTYFSPSLGFTQIFGKDASRTAGGITAAECSKGTMLVVTSEFGGFAAVPECLNIPTAARPIARTRKAAPITSAFLGLGGGATAVTVRPGRVSDIASIRRVSLSSVNPDGASSHCGVERKYSKSA